MPKCSAKDMKRRNIITSLDNFEEEFCYNDGANPPLLFLRANIEDSDKLETICLSLDDAEKMLKEKTKTPGSFIPNNGGNSINSFPYIVNGFTEKQYQDMNYFISCYSDDDKYAKIDADVSDARSESKLYPSRRKVNLPDEGERSKRVYDIIKSNNYNEYYETKNGEEFFFRTYGGYLHSPDENSPSKENLKTGEKQFHNHGILVKSIDSDGKVRYFSQNNSKEIK